MIRIKKSWYIFGFAVGAGLLATFSASKYMKEKISQIEANHRQVMVPRIVAAHDLSVGTSIDSAVLAVREIPETWISSDSLSPDEFERIEGKVITSPLMAGDPVLWAHTSTISRRPFSEKVGLGRRAVTMPVDTINSVSGLIVPGDLIDLYVSFKYKNRDITAPLLQGVLVLATDKESKLTNDGTEREFSTVTLDTSPEEAAKLVAARQDGVITAFLRNPDDKEASQKGVKGDLASILGIATNGPIVRKKASVIYGDQGTKKMSEIAQADVEQTPTKEELLQQALIELPGQKDIVSAWISENTKKTEIATPQDQNISSKEEDLENDE